MFKMRGWLILANDHEPKSPIFSSKILSCLLSPSFEAEKSLGRITIRLKGEVDMKWWLFRVIGVERLLWRVRASTKQMTFQWQSKSIGFRLFGPTMTILFSRQSRAGKCKRRTKQMTFQWQSRASQTLMLATSWQGPDVHSNTFVSGRVLTVHWLCICCALGTLERMVAVDRRPVLLHTENWVAMITAFGHQRERNICALHSTRIIDTRSNLQIPLEMRSVRKVDRFEYAARRCMDPNQRAIQYEARIRINSSRPFCTLLLYGGLLPRNRDIDV